MTDQNLAKGDPVYPSRHVTHHATIEGNASPLVFVKGEFATFDANRFLVKLTTTRILGLIQVKNDVTGGLAGDDTVEVPILQVPGRVLASLPAGAKKGDQLEINGTDGTGNLVVSTVGPNAILSVGVLFELYRNTAVVASAADLGVVELGVY